MCNKYTYIYEFCPNAFLHQMLPLHSGILFASPGKIWKIFISGSCAFYSKFVHDNRMLAIGAWFFSLLSSVFKLNIQLKYLGPRRLSRAERAASKSPWRFFFRLNGFFFCVLFITAATLLTLTTDWEFRNAYEWCAASVIIIRSASHLADGLSFLFLFLGCQIPNWITGLISGLRAPM